MPDTRVQLARLGMTDAEIEAWLALERAGACIAALPQMHRWPSTSPRMHCTGSRTCCYRGPAGVPPAADQVVTCGTPTRCSTPTKTA